MRHLPGKYLLLAFILSVSFISNNYPKGWIRVGTEHYKGHSFEVYFFDYLTRVPSVVPDIRSYKERAYTNKLEDVHFMYPLYVFRESVSDSFEYFILRPDPKKRGAMFSFEIDIVKTKDSVGLNSFEEKNSYAPNISKTLDQVGCMSGLIYEYHHFIQKDPGKQNIGGGIRITDSIITRVIPYEETKAQVFNSIQKEL